MSEHLSKLSSIAADAIAAVAAAATLQELEDVRVRFTGRKSALGDVQKMMGKLDDAGRKELGQALNRFKGDFQRAFDARDEELSNAVLGARLENERLDLSLPPRALPAARPHLLTQVEEEIIDVFLGLGYTVADGPHIESTAYAFDALNIPPDHPARQEMDTIYVREGGRDEFGLPKIALRPHTSPVQARVMMGRPLPIAVVVPGRTYRNDSVDATHSPVFTQVEGLLVGEGITMADLKGTLLAFARSMFGESREIRLRPSMFPFTEPSAEMDVSWGNFANEDGSQGATRWIEILGSGMVDPSVLTYCGLDPDKVSGFAFGVGVERVAMLRHGVADIRDFYEGDARFLDRF
ncbi:MAG: phenylalanyl-tRNA synthetase alpha chain [Glaciecola sp.]